VSTEIIVDTRELEAPEPMTVVLNNLCKLDENTSIKMVHRIEPQMLYTHLDINDLKYKVVCKDDDVFIYIWNNTFKEKDIFKDIV
jgi:uncharacterized protein (DUF2249 family)